MLALTLAVAVIASAPQPGLTVDDMLAFDRISEPVLAPDATRIAYTLRTTDLAANRGRTDLWLVDVATKATRRLTSNPAGDFSPQWAPDGRSLYFLSSRSGSTQVWQLSLAGGEATQVSDLPLDVNTLAVAADGKHLVISLDVYPDAKTLAETAARDAKPTESSAQIYNALLFRHWDTWEDGKRSHVFALDLDHPSDARDLMRGMDADSPEHPFGGGEEIAVSPDAKTVAFVARNATRDAAWSTNLDVYLVPLDGSAPPVVVTTSLGADHNPVWSPDGKRLAVLSQATAGYESDKERILIIDPSTKSSVALTDAWDFSASELAWSLDGKRIYTSADNLGQHSLFELDVASKKVKLLVKDGTNGSLMIGKGIIAYTHDSLTQPTELFTTKGQLTHTNDARLAKIGFSAYEQFTFKGAHGDTVYGFAVQPHGFVAGQKYPVAMIIHGGPQGSMGDHFHYRWNPMAVAAAGFAVVFIDFHGSTGYGQAFTDSIRGDWGGAPYDDLMIGLDAALAKYPYMDKARQVALGASFGGYMINWINGQTDRFKALVCHDGNIDERMAFYDTEELWFPERDHEGLPWTDPDHYNKHNPIDHVANWKTPTLVIHGGLDYRVVDTQGMATFTALQRKGIPSRFIYFPDENHWVLKPKNSVLWHHEVLGWLTEWANK